MSSRTDPQADSFIALILISKEVFRLNEGREKSTPYKKSATPWDLLVCVCSQKKKSNTLGSLDYVRNLSVLVDDYSDRSRVIRNGACLRMEAKNCSGLGLRLDFPRIYIFELGKVLSKGSWLDSYPPVYWWISHRTQNKVGAKKKKITKESIKLIYFLKPYSF